MTTRQTPAPRGRRLAVGRPLVLLVVTSVWLAPLIWTISLSLRPQSALARSTSGVLPVPFSLENYATVLFSSQLPRWLLNSLVVTAVHITLVLLLSVSAGYAFARLDFPGRHVLFLIATAGLMVPSQVVLIPIYITFADLGLHNTYPALFLPGIGTAAPFALFIMTQFMGAIPHDIEEAARLDGAGDLRVLLTMIVPLCRPAIVVVAIIQFTAIWNDFMWPLLSSSRTEWMTLTVGISTLVRTAGGDALLGQTLAAAWSAATPIIIFFLFFQKQLMRGISLNVESF